ncbi:hypothetical protein PG994_009757, partial [Apiospora phragmitis]
FRRRYFTFIAPKYAHLTGNTTRDLFAAALRQHDLALTNESVIHDSAADLSAVFPEDGCLTHVIDNFSLSTFGTREQQLKGLAENYRTLKADGGVAVFTTWKKFAMSELIGAAQAILLADSPSPVQVKGANWAAAQPVPMNGPEFVAEGHLASMLAEAGWSPTKTQTSLVKSVVTRDEDEKGLLEFMQVSPPAKAAAWPAAVQQAVDAMKKEHGGIYGETWVVIARK